MVVLSVRWIVAHQKVEEAPERGLSGVSACGAVASMAFEVVKERDDSIDVNVGESQCADRASADISEKGEVEPQRVRVRAYRMWACSAHSLQVVLEERRDEARQSVGCPTFHCWVPHR